MFVSPIGQFVNCDTNRQIIGFSNFTNGPVFGAGDSTLDFTALIFSKQCFPLNGCGWTIFKRSVLVQLMTNQSHESEQSIPFRESEALFDL